MTELILLNGTEWIRQEGGGNIMPRKFDELN